MADIVIQQMTQEKIVYAIISHLTGGLQGVTNHPFSAELIADEIDNVRLELIKNSKVLQTLDFRLLSQALSCVEVIKVPDQECIDLGLNGFFWRTKEKIPKMLSIPGKPLVDYIGAANWMQKYTLEPIERIANVQYDRYKFPSAFWINDYFYFMYLPPNTSVIGLIAPFERPAQVVKKFFCCKDQSYPIPGEFIAAIVRNLVDNYRRYGYFSNPQPNTQTQINTQGGGR